MYTLLLSFSFLTSLVLSLFTPLLCASIVCTSPRLPFCVSFSLLFFASLTVGFVCIVLFVLFVNE
ncbi:MAG: hypothetical protein J3R72DRAFT_452926 [Linnemannia gamsii]|nr:MAG: hypothetical protein J3R72DRAFT_452926 [Linnemannia gamsii]